MCHHDGDPYRASMTAVAGARDGVGLRAHVEDALAAGLNAHDAAAQAVDSFYAGTGTGFGEALVQQGGYQAPARGPVPDRGWDELDRAERMIVSSFMASTQRAGQEPTSEDIADALVLR